MAAAPDDFPGYIRQAMKSAGIMSQADLSRISGISSPVLSRWLRDNQQPEIPNLRKLAKPLKVTVLELVVAAGHLSPAEARMKDRPLAPDTQTTPFELGVAKAISELADPVRKSITDLIGSLAASSDPERAAGPVLSGPTASNKIEEETELAGDNRNPTAALGDNRAQPPVVGSTRGRSGPATDPFETAAAASDAFVTDEPAAAADAADGDTAAEEPASNGIGH